MPESEYKRQVRVKREELAAAAAKRRAQQETTMVCYFITIDGSDNIKIGTTVNLKKRMQSFRTYAEPTILATMPGGFLTENALHKRFAAYRVRGEWFSPSKELLDYIDFINAGGIPRERYQS